MPLVRLLLLSSNNTLSPRRAKNKRPTERNTPGTNQDAWVLSLEICLLWGGIFGSNYRFLNSSILKVAREWWGDALCYFFILFFIFSFVFCFFAWHFDNGKIILFAALAPLACWLSSGCEVVVCCLSALPLLYLSAKLNEALAKLWREIAVSGWGVLSLIHISEPTRPP